MAKPKIGDVLEIKTAKGFVYAQITHVHETHGPLLRVLPNFHDRRPENPNGLVDQSGWLPDPTLDRAV
jgi:hypothetical protein